MITFGGCERGKISEWSRAGEAGIVMVYIAVTDITILNSIVICAALCLFIEEATGESEEVVV